VNDPSLNASMTLNGPIPICRRMETTVSLIKLALMFAPIILFFAWVAKDKSRE
jgi:hypothetical protein